MREKRRERERERERERKNAPDNLVSEAAINSCT